MTLRLLIAKPFAEELGRDMRLGWLLRVLFGRGPRSSKQPVWLFFTAVSQPLTNSLFVVTPDGRATLLR
jgi:hypothetical protein